MPSCSPASSRSCAAAALRERQHLVDDGHAHGPTDELVGALEVRLRAHRRAEDRQLLPPDAVERRGRVRPARRAADAIRPSGARDVERCAATSPRRRDRRRRRRRARRWPPSPAATTSSVSWLNVTSAPSSRARSSFSSLDEVTIVRAPSAFAIASAGGRDAAADAPERAPTRLLAAARVSRASGRPSRRRAGTRPPPRRRARPESDRRSWPEPRSAPRSCRRRARRSRGSLPSPASTPGLITTRSPGSKPYSLAERLDDPGTVGAEDARLRHRRKTLADPDVEMVERRGAQADQHLARARRRDPAPPRARAPRGRRPRGSAPPARGHTIRNDRS